MVTARLAMRPAGILSSYRSRAVAGGAGGCRCPKLSETWSSRDACLSSAKLSLSARRKLASIASGGKSGLAPLNSAPR